MSVNQSFGNYTLIKKLATGGMAEVWLAKQQGIEGFNRHVVVKRILPHLAEDPEFVQMFLNEAKIAARFNHPNIGQIFDLGETGGQYYIAMEFIHGEDLGRVMRRAWSTGQWIARHIALRVIADTCQGLYYAHTRNDEQGRPLRVVHRDISPQNILISFDGAVKVVDFGIAKASDQVSNTKSGAIKGKFAYMAPEQAAGKPLDARSDLFAVGLVLYELVTGVRPLKRDSELATLQAALECKIDPPSAVAEVPGELDGIVMRALAKAPDDRYVDAREFQRALEQYLLNSKEMATSAEVSELMAALFADRLGEEARLGAPNPSTESSTSNPVPPSYSSAPQSVTAPPPPPPRPPPSRDNGVRASPSMTMSDDDEVDDDDEATIAPEEPEVLRGGYELPAGTVVPSRAYLKKDATVAARGSKPEMTRMAPIEDDGDARPVKRKTATRASAAYVPSAPSDDDQPKRRPTGQLAAAKRRTSSGVMPEAPPRSKSRASMPIENGERPRPSGDNISKIVDVAGMKERQRSRLKALISVLVLIGALVLTFVFKDNLLSALNRKAISEDGVPVRLSVKTNPPVVVTVIPPPGVKNRSPLELGRTPIDEQSGAFVGDTVLLVNEDRGIRYKEVIEFGQPNELKLISKTFKESAVRIRTTPTLKAATVWRGNYKLGQVGVNLSLFPGTHNLEIRSDQLAQPHQFVVEFADNSKNLDINEDVSAEMEKK